MKPAVVKMHILSARNYFDQSLKEWQRYEKDLWSEKNHYNPEFEKEDAFKRRVDMAIQYGEQALSDIMEIETENSYEIVRMRYDIINNLAYHLGTKKAAEDYRIALNLCEKLSQLIPEITRQELGEEVPPDSSQWKDEVADLALWVNRNALETIVWVTFRFETEWKPDGTIVFPATSLNILTQLFAGGVFEESDQKNYQEKYEKIFGLKLIFDDEASTDIQGNGESSNTEQMPSANADPLG